MMTQCAIFMDAQGNLRGDLWSEAGFPAPNPDEVAVATVTCTQQDCVRLHWGRLVPKVEALPRLVAEVAVDLDATASGEGWGPILHPVAGRVRVDLDPTASGEAWVPEERHPGQMRPRTREEWRDLLRRVAVAAARDLMARKPRGHAVLRAALAALASVE